MVSECTKLSNAATDQRVNFKSIQWETQWSFERLLNDTIVKLAPS